MKYKDSLCVLIYAVSVVVYTAGVVSYCVGNHECDRLDVEWWRPKNWFMSEDRYLCLTPSGKIVYGARELGYKTDEAFAYFLLSSDLFYAMLLCALWSAIRDTVRWTCSFVDAVNMDGDIVTYLQKWWSRNRKVTWNTAVEEFHYNPD